MARGKRRANWTWADVQKAEAAEARRMAVNRDPLFETICAVITPDSPKELAERAEVSCSTLYSWRIGHTRNPRLNTVRKVALALGFDLNLESHVNVVDIRKRA